jgi:hypothetical protein
MILPTRWPRSMTAGISLASCKPSRKQDMACTNRLLVLSILLSASVSVYDVKGQESTQGKQLIGAGGVQIAAVNRDRLWGHVKVLCHRDQASAGGGRGGLRRHGSRSLQGARDGLVGRPEEGPLGRLAAIPSVPPRRQAGDGGTSYRVQPARRACTGIRQRLRKGPNSHGAGYD